MLQEVVEWFGSQANLARALHVDRAAVSHWVARGWCGQPLGGARLVAAQTSSGTGEAIWG